ncbi:MAG TPA: primosomal protein N' [Gemmatimonadaceae bacterium]|nr:primosomal protein N' [Gemmatimonadaceae bacterium]
MTPPASRLIEVALPLPLFQTFTYAVDGTLANQVVPGSRVLVPVRSRRAIGICLGDATATVARPRAILDAPDPEPVLSTALLGLCRWIAEYYVVPLGIVMRAVLPAALTGADVPRPAAHMRRTATIARALPSLQERDDLFGRAVRQRALYEALESLGGEADVSHLTTQLGFAGALIHALETKGLIALRVDEVRRDPFSARPRAEATSHVPTAPQREAVAALAAASGGEVFLLRGITGSGKTLVYLEFLKEVVRRRGQSAMVLVPEIALTPQTVDRFRAVFGDLVAVLHSALGDGERYDAWRALAGGEARIVVGARSAIFAPLANLGAIILDEEHETSYKNGEAPRYHARDVAIVRARDEGAVVVLGSATPSLESWHNAERGKFRLLTLPERAGAGRLPQVSVVDLRIGARSPMPDDLPDPFRRVIGEAIEDGLRERMARGEQSILLLNRRGYASFIQCGACGYVATCPNCSISLTYHRTPERLVCHYCRYEEPPAGQCPRCAGRTLRQRGLGTQQVERLLGDRFPRARIARMDVDTTSGKWAHATILDRVARGDVDILLGTQMIAKGLDFPNVTLVGVIDADVGINLPDFRASERSFQLLSQVAGRAGRGPKGGAVVIQTRMPAHHSVRHALTHDYLAFVGEEMPGRAEPPYPPMIRLINVIISGTVEVPTEELAQRVSAWLVDGTARSERARITVLGPAPCPIERIHKRWRWHVVLKSEHAGALGSLARALLERFEVPARHGLRIAVDRDPVSLL